MKPILALLLAFCAWHGLSFAAAPTGTASESSVKAAFLHRIAGLVEWPAGSFQDADDPLVIGVAGNDAVATDLEQLAEGRRVNGRAIVVRRWRDGDSPAGLHVLLIGAAREARVQDLASIAGPLLVVTEQEDGHRLGGVINFVVVDGRVRFTASLPQADARGLRLSARLLAVAHSVEGRGR